jgi:hypothetical protein
VLGVLSYRFSNKTNLCLFKLQRVPSQMHGHQSKYNSQFTAGRLWIIAKQQTRSELYCPAKQQQLQHVPLYPLALFSSTVLYSHLKAY